tara:strand:+ start:4039 stop:4335 length:297 start_codon:yes stop_codon:yes gene_type:complete
MNFITYKVVSNGASFPQNSTNQLLPELIFIFLSHMITSVQCALPIIECNTTLIDGVENESPLTPDHGNNHGLKDHEFIFIAVICIWVIGACYGACFRK